MELPERIYRVINGIKMELGLSVDLLKGTGGFETDSIEHGIILNHLSILEEAIPHFKRELKSKIRQIADRNFIYPN